MFNEQLVTILDELAILDNKEYFDIFKKAENSLQRGTDELSVKAVLIKDISYCLMTHKYQAPKIVIDFYQEISGSLESKRGQISIPFLLSTIFKK